ncbi:MAG: sigma-70 family RNA polymerase sigma factor [Oscillospiraceae bacterium]|nr:sigma-70 family RNA polymerase sigma factor [Oscillospiraceae bacterium]
MKDSEIVALYLSRSESALTESKKQYGRLIQHIIRNIIRNQLDAEECENDTYLSAWQSIPPNQPKSLKAYLAVIARNTACRKWEYLNAEKRNPEMLISLDELGDSIADDSGQDFSDQELKEVINQFLSTIKKDHRKVFLLRYWRFCSVQEISQRTGFSKAKVESILFRTRNKLRKYLIERGFTS